MHFILLPSSLPPSSFPFPLCPALAAALPLLYIYIINGPLLSVCCSCVSAYHFLTPFLPSLPLSLLAFLPLFSFFFCKCNPSTLKEPRSHSSPAIASVYWYASLVFLLSRLNFALKSSIFDGIFQSFYLCHHFVNRYTPTPTSTTTATTNTTTTTTTTTILDLLLYFCYQLPLLLRPLLRRLRIPTGP